MEKLKSDQNGKLEIGISNTQKDLYIMSPCISVKNKMHGSLQRRPGDGYRSINIHKICIQRKPDKPQQEVEIRIGNRS